jgi:small subunit ribosomal protein S16
MRSTSKRDGLAIKEIGFYNPITNQVKLNKEEILVFLKNGVKPTKTVFNLLVKNNIITKKIV